MRDTIYRMITDTVEDCVNTSISEDQAPEQWDMKELEDMLLPIIPLPKLDFTKDQIRGMKKNDLIQQLKEDAVKLYEEKEVEFTETEQIREVEPEVDGSH